MKNIQQHIKNALVLRMKKKSSTAYLNDLKMESSKINLKTLTKQQIKKIDDYYYAMTGMKVNHHWHQYFYSRNNIFSEKYIPVDFYNNELIYRLNSFGMRHAYSDKNAYDILFSDFKRPKTILQCINGFYYQDNLSISYKKALDICHNLEDVIIKPSLEGTWGKGVEFISIKNGISDINALPINKVFDLYKGNFIIQDYINQHSDISALNQSSVNTIRVITYRSQSFVKPVDHVIRIGKAGSKVDNVRFGGINVKIHENGELNKIGYGFDATKSFYKSTSGVLLDQYKIPNFDKVIRTAKEMHLRLPYFRLVGWDFALDNENNVVFIEWNRAPDLLGQYYGPPFGEFTDEILSSVKKYPNTRRYTL